MFNLIDEEIKRCGQTLANCIGFATGGASNMVGCNNSLWSRLRAVISFLCATQMYLSFAGPLHSICSIKATIKYWIFTFRNIQLVSPY